MDELKLMKLDIEYEKQICDYRDEFLTFGKIHVSPNDGWKIDNLDSIPGSSSLLCYENISDWFLNCQLYENKETLPNKNHVTATQYLTIRQKDNKCVGTVSLRHELNEELRNYDGHIGYSIRPSERRKGYANEQLKLCFEKAKECGLDEILICCKEYNEASRRVILSCGGKFERRNFGPLYNLYVELYWIKL